MAVGPWRVAVPLERPLHIGRRTMRVSLQGAQERLQPGDTAVVEFFYPGEQARGHCARAGHSPS